VARQASKTRPSGEIDPDFFFLLSGFGVRRDGPNLKQNWYLCSRDIDGRSPQRYQAGWV